MEKERKITAPEGCKIEKVEIVDGVAVVTFKQKDRKLPKNWEEFCKMFPVRIEEFYVSDFSEVLNRTDVGDDRHIEEDRNMLPDRATAEAVLALCQLIQLRECYNGDWVPDWNDTSVKHTIEFESDRIFENYSKTFPQILYFKTKDLRDEFFKYFRPLIEKLKPLYGIMKGGENE